MFIRRCRPTKLVTIIPANWLQATFTFTSVCFIRYPKARIRALIYRIARLARASVMQSILDCYRVIGVQPGISPKALKKAYRDLVKRWHPDRFPNDSEKRKEAEEKIKAINLAFERIQDHRETLIALASRKPGPPAGASRPRAATPSPRSGGRASRSRADTKPPPTTASKAPRAQAAPARSPAATPQNNSLAAWLAPLFRPALLAVGSALFLFILGLTFFFHGQKAEPPAPMAEDERMVPLAEINFRRGASTVDGSPAPDTGGTALPPRMAERAPTQSAAPAPANGGLASALSRNAETVGHDSVDPVKVGFANALAEEKPADPARASSQASKPRGEPVGENSPALGAAPPLISEELRAKLIAQSESPRPAVPRPEDTADGQFRAALRFAHGDGVLQDYAEAARLYRLAAEAGHAEAQKNLGFLYSEGKGVPRDAIEAEKWFGKAAAQGIASAQFAGALLAHAKTNSPAEGASRDLARTSLSGMDNPIRSPLLKGLVRKNSPATNQNETTRLAAPEPKDPDAQYALGLRYEKADGVKRDFTAALKWYRLAADAGHAVAQKKLADLYASGKGVTQDFAEARKWYEKAAASGAVGAGVRRASAAALNPEGAVEADKSAPPSSSNPK